MTERLIQKLTPRPTREEVITARTTFGQWFPVHGVLATQRNTLYVGLHRALTEGHVDRKGLVTLGNAVKTALKERPREEVKKVVETAEVIHDTHGLRPALAYLRGELHSTTPATAVPVAIGTAVKPPTTQEADVLRRLFNFRKPGLYYTEPTPSLLMTEMRKILGRKGKVKPEKEEDAITKRVNRHARLLQNQLFKLRAFERILHCSREISAKTNIAPEHVEKALLPILDAGEETKLTGNVYDVSKLFDRLIEIEAVKDAETFKRAVKAVKTSFDQVKKSKFKNTYRPYSRNLLERVHRNLPRVYPYQKMTIDEFERLLQKETASHIKEIKENDSK